MNDASSAIVVRARLLFVILAAALIIPQIVLSQDVVVMKRIAVFPFASQHLSDEEQTQFRSQLIQAISTSPNVRVMGDVAMNAIIAELKFDKLEECNSPACATYFGKILGVDVVLAGSIKKEGDRFTGMLRLVKVEDSEVMIERSFDHTGPLSAVLAGGTPPLADDLSNITFEPDSKYRWYAIGAAVVGGGILVYFVAKGLGLIGGKAEYTDPGQKLPPTDTQ
ncbi:MAG: hypothetical protein FJ215_06045 [Ignavibacteria bacterium]|nr:hypothetical protein [Ignavibacteria bacterium]